MLENQATEQLESQPKENAPSKMRTPNHNKITELVNFNAHLQVRLKEMKRTLIVGHIFTAVLAAALGGCVVALVVG